ncbi:unnamed protein product [Linum trigynum]|uniref:Aminotransferase-like plant mobile domain-containing protein n=1 Tax=Linum trigynum TaxID=586398 RepID=A0AAV2CHL5_9ROSI
MVSLGNSRGSRSSGGAAKRLRRFIGRNISASVRNRDPNDRDEPQPQQLVTPMSLRGDGFPQFDFQMPSMAGSGAGPSRDHASPFEPSDEIDDESEEYDSDGVEYHILPVSPIRDRGAPSGSSHIITGVHVVIGIYRDHVGRFYRAPQPGKGQSGTADVGEAWEPRGPCLGGPSDPSLLRSFFGHVAHRLYTREADRMVITCYDRSSTLRHVLDGYVIADDNTRTTVETAGLAHLVDITFQSELDPALVSTFVERWQPDTNTFHMPFGETMILLHDVAHIIGLAVEGEAMVVDPRQLEKWALETDIRGTGM